MWVADRIQPPTTTTTTTANTPNHGRRHNQHQWKIWSIFAALRMTAHLVTIALLIVCSRRFERTHRVMVFLHNARNFLDASGLIWFLVSSCAP